MQAADSLTFSQRECFYRSRLLSKSFPIRAALFSAYGQLRRNGGDDAETPNFGRRFGAYYASHTAQNTGEFLAGYWNHEDPRYKPSLERGIWKRSRSAVFSVLIAKDTDGSTRMAFAPLAGAFGSGLAGAACYRNQSFMEEGLRGSATSYGFYFATAILREFKPELNHLVSRMTRGRFSR